MSFLGKIFGAILNPASLLENVVGAVAGPLGGIASSLIKGVLSPIVGNLSMFPVQLVKSLPGILKGLTGLLGQIGKVLTGPGAAGICHTNPMPAPISTPPSTGFGSIMNHAMDKISGMYSEVQDLMNNLPDDPMKAQKQMMKAQMLMQSIQQMMTMLTNMMKTMHNINMSIIGNLKG